MCIQDWRLGRYIRTIGRTVQIGVATPFTIEANPQRVGLLAMGHGNGFSGGDTFWIHLNGVQIRYINSIVANRELTLLTDGDAPTRKLTIETDAAGPINVDLTEWIMPEEYLSAGYQEWINQHKLQAK